MPAHPLLPGFPVILEQALAWGDMDSFGHVNNVVYFRFFEMARIELLNLAGWMDQKDKLEIGPIIASTAAKYRKALKYPDTILIGARVSEMSTDRVTIQHVIVSRSLDAIAAEGPAVTVNFNYRTGEKTPFSDTLRSQLERMQ
jgi:acyl-CoA thioester hydrolase